MFAHLHTDASVVTDKTRVAAHGVTTVAGGRCARGVHVTRVITATHRVTARQHLTPTVSVTVDVVIQTRAT